jgi:NADPH-dependent 2,4-dienoyl-CoA reductase/sulfur reductase-like enzyme/peroxiredoxin family protein/rhodanese-related sulfurtransferase/TusA-related sulfurtransferase
MSEKTRLVIIGGVAGGASAAARARRLDENAEIIVLERGEYVSFANCGLPYHIGGVIKDRDRLLVQTPQTLHSQLRLDVRIRTEALRIDTQRKEVAVKNLENGTEYSLPYDKLILSPGAEPIKPPIPGTDNAKVKTLRSMADMDSIIEILDRDKPNRVLVVGGGYIGLEMAEALVERKVGVTLVELAPQVMAPVDPEMASPLHVELSANGVDLRLETSLVELTEDSKGLVAHLSTGDILECGLVILAIGVKPDTKLAVQAGLVLGERGGILVDDRMRTSQADVFAVGDAIEVTDFVGGFQTLIPLAGPANRQGRIAADNAFGRDSVYKKTQGTGICKVFGLAAGMTGMNEKSLKRLGKSYEKVYVHPANHASYYPGATPLSLKVIFDPSDGTLLGAQAVGANGVDKRIDVLAVAIRASLTVYDLEEMELSYAPPYGSAKDPINYAGFVAGNVLRGDAQICHVADVMRVSSADSQQTSTEAQHDSFLLDVRNPPEVAAGTIPGSVNIPLPALRDRLSEVPKDKDILVFCQVGLRGYLACRILSQYGYNCKNLTGGYKTYTQCTQSLTCRVPPPAPKEVTDDSGSTGSTSKESDQQKPVNIVRLLDTCGLQCPGPIMQVSLAMEQAKDGEAVEVLSTDPGFSADIGPWCNSTGNRLVESGKLDGKYRAVIAKGHPKPASSSDGVSSKKKTIVVFSGELDKALAAFVIANGATSMGSEVTMFFTFWGLNVLRKSEQVSVKKNLIETMFGWMMPRGADKLQLSNMNMGGIGPLMIKGIMKQKNVNSLPEFIQSAQRSGVHMVACTMSMDLMGIKPEELIDGVEYGGVAAYLSSAEQGSVNLFV